MKITRKENQTLFVGGFSFKEKLETNFLVLEKIYENFLWIEY